VVAFTDAPALQTLRPGVDHNCLGGFELSCGCRGQTAIPPLQGCEADQSESCDDQPVHPRRPAIRSAASALPPVTHPTGARTRLRLASIFFEISFRSASSFLPTPFSAVLKRATLYAMEAIVSRPYRLLMSGVKPSISVRIFYSQGSRPFSVLKTVMAVSAGGMATS
jgi:hypothetical protein